MKKSSLAAALFALLLLPFALTGCGGGGASSPTDAVKAMFEAGAAGNAEAGLAVMAKADIKAQADRTRKRIAESEEVAKEYGVTAEEAKTMDDKALLLKGKAEKSGMDVSKIEYVKETINGDKATVEVKVGENSMTMDCVKEDGSWKITMMAAMAEDLDDDEPAAEEDGTEK